MPLLPVMPAFPATPSPGIAALPSSRASPRRSAPEQGPGPDCARRLSAGYACSPPPCSRVSAAIRLMDTYFLIFSAVGRNVSAVPPQGRNPRKGRSKNINE